MEWLLVVGVLCFLAVGAIVGFVWAHEHPRDDEEQGEEVPIWKLMKHEQEEQDVKS